MESLKTYENILDLDGLESLKFNHLTLESMHMRQTSVKKQQKKVSYLINQTTRNNNSPTRNTPSNSDKKPGSARFGNRPVSRQSPRVKDPGSARSNTKNVEQGLTKKESLKKIVVEKKEAPSPKLDVVKVDPITPATVATIKIEEDRYGKSASPGLRKSHQALIADTSMEVPQLTQRDHVPQALNLSHDVNLTPNRRTVNADVSQDQIIIKGTPLPEINAQAALSEISFFYEDGQDEEASDAELDSNAQFILIQGAHCQGKAVHQCEDAYFISDRAFGVSDGVSGWNDYGFSSDQFSLQLMSNSKKCIERCIRRAIKGKTNGKKHKGPKSAAGGLSKSRSFLSMDNLDIQEEKEENEESSNESDNNKPMSSDSDEPLELRSKQKSTVDKAKEDDGEFKGDSKALKTERTAREGSPLIKNEDGNNSQTMTNKSITVEEEIQKKLNEPKINQEYINNWEWGVESAPILDQENATA